MRRDNWVRDAGVAGSNPATPTNNIKCLEPLLFFASPGIPPRNAGFGVLRAPADQFNPLCGFPDGFIALEAATRETMCKIGDARSDQGDITTSSSIPCACCRQGFEPNQGCEAEGMAAGEIQIPPAANAPRCDSSQCCGRDQAQSPTTETAAAATTHPEIKPSKR